MLHSFGSSISRKRQVPLSAQWAKSSITRWENKKIEVFPLMLQMEARRWHKLISMALNTRSRNLFENLFCLEGKFHFTPHPSLSLNSIPFTAHTCILAFKKKSIRIFWTNIHDKHHKTDDFKEAFSQIHQRRVRGGERALRREALGFCLEIKGPPYGRAT